MCNLKNFREVNNLTQSELGDYIEMKKSFISKIENGKEKLPSIKLQKLLSNDKGWDVSMLLDQSPTINATATGNGSIEIGQQKKFFAPINSDASEVTIAVLKKEIEMLREQLADKDNQIEFLKRLLDR